jgi:beta-glucosidase
MSTTGPVTFPAGFLWGAATAAYQIEGAVSADGRSASIWDTYSHSPGRVRNGDTGDRACDHYNRLDQDLDLIGSLGLGSYRFSIAWPRVQPDGKGPANQAGLDFYKRLVDGLRQRNVEPMATLYHWDLPQVLEDEGGWTNRETAERFGEMAALVGEALGESVGMWVTLNEPWCSAWLGYGLGVQAPGHTDLELALRATHHLLLGHGRAVDALRSTGRAPVGITVNLAAYRPASSDPADQAAAARADGYQNRLFLDPVLRGQYPGDMVEHFERHRPGLGVAQEGDLQAISRPLDFLGVNYYSSNTVSAPERLDQARTAGYIVSRREPDLIAADLQFRGLGNPDVPRTAIDWEIHPDGLTELLVRLRADYGDLPIYITENGAACDDYVDPEGEIEDVERIAYFDLHLRAIHAAIEAGVDVRGYFAWSLMDNFEWSYGYGKRFGLVWVDYPTGERLPKDSFHWYRHVIAANALG